MDTTCLAGVMSEARNLAEILRIRALHQADRVAYTFHTQDGWVDLTYAQLHARAIALAQRLRRRGLRGQRVVIGVPPGEPFVVSFLACLCADATAVPVYPPRSLADAERVIRIINDAEADALLTTTAGVSLLGSLNLSALGMRPLALIAVDADDGDADPEPAALQVPLEGGAPALLQYTSGSTTHPKGVVLSHANLLSNLDAIRVAFGHDPARSRGVIWLPPYHDMGLIGGVLQPLYVGFPALLMSPTTFVKRPLAWLEAISSYRATTSGGPNFAYELCLRRVPAHGQRPELDLSSWDVAFCGAEPINHGTLAAFADAFSGCGFRRSAFYPCYGLAEATLIVTGGRSAHGPEVVAFERESLEKNRAVPVMRTGLGISALVACGTPVGGTSVRVVQPETRQLQADGCVGEIWISGPGVAGGYWKRAEQTQEVFAARVAGQPGTYLRSGDLGFIWNERLFVTGRAKELIIVRGVNHYPHDIEASVQATSGALRAGRGVALGVATERGEEVIIIQELEDAAQQPEQLFEPILQILSSAHGLRPGAVHFVARGTIAVTSSGKLRRAFMREQYLADRVKPLVSWRDASPAPDGAMRELAPANWLRDPGTLERYLCAELARLRDVPVSSVPATHTFAQLGVDSVTALELVGAWEELGIVLDPSEFYEHPTPRALARRLYALAEQRRTAPERAAGERRTDAGERVRGVEAP